MLSKFIMQKTAEMLAYLRAKSLSTGLYVHIINMLIIRLPTSLIMSWCGSPTHPSYSLSAFVLWVPDDNGNACPYTWSVSLACHSSSTHKTFIKCLLFARCWAYDSLLVQDLYLWGFHSNRRSSIKK